MLGALPARGVELRDRARRTSRIPSHLVERDEPVVAVEGGVLDPLRHDRAGGLLEAGDEALVPGLLEQQHAGHALAQAGPAHGLAHGLAVGLGHPPGAGVDVGPVDREGGHGGGQLVVVERAGQALDLGGEGGARLLALGLARDLGERPLLAGDLAVEVRSGSSPAGSTNSRPTSFRKS